MEGFHLNELVPFFIALVIGFLWIFIFFKMFRFLKRKGSSKVFFFGATDQFNARSRDKAVEVILNKDSGEKMEEQTSSDPVKKNSK